MLGRIEGGRRGRQRIRCLDGITDLTDKSLSKLWEIAKDGEAWRAAVHGITVRHDWATELNCVFISFALGDWSKKILLWFMQRMFCLCSLLGVLWCHVLYCVAQSCPCLCHPMGAVARQALLSMGFSMYEYWSGLPFPPPGDLLNPGVEPRLLTSPSLAGGFFTTTITWEALSYIRSLNNLEFIFVYVWRNVPTCCFPCSCPAFPAPLTVEPVLSSGEIFELIWWDTTRWQSDAVVKCAYSQEFGNFFEQQHFLNLNVPLQNVTPAQIARCENEREFFFFRKSFCLPFEYLQLKYSCNILTFPFKWAVGKQETLYGFWTKGWDLDVFRKARPKKDEFFLTFGK